MRRLLLSVAVAAALSVTLAVSPAAPATGLGDPAAPAAADAGPEPELEVFDDGWWPAGVDPDAPTDTASLYARAGLGTPAQERRAWRAWADRAAGAGGPRARAQDTGEPGEPGESGVGVPYGPVPPGRSPHPSMAHHVRPSCSGTGTDGNRVQLLYVRTRSQPGRLAELRPLFWQAAAGVDTLLAVGAEETGGGRRVRWVHQDCVPTIDRVVLADGQLDDPLRLRDRLHGRGFRDPTRHYVAFVESDTQCGLAWSYRDPAKTENFSDGRYAGWAGVYAPCWGQATSTLMHEIWHLLGAVSDLAPNSTGAAHCTDEHDLMCYTDASGLPMSFLCPRPGTRLDCNHDDYFHTDPAPGSYLATHWNTADSSFLDPARTLRRHRLEVSIPDRVAAGEPVTMTAVTDPPPAGGWPPGEEPALSWEATTGCTLSVRPPGGTAELTCPSEASLHGTTVTATARDVDGAAVTARTWVEVTAPPWVRIAHAHYASHDGFTLVAHRRGQEPREYAWDVEGCTATPQDVDNGDAGQAAHVACPAGLAGQQVRATVTLTVEDQQATDQLLVTVPGADPLPTRWTDEQHHTDPRTRTVTLTGALRTGAVPVHPHPVYVQARWAGEDTWQLLTTPAAFPLSTGPDGQVAYTHPVDRGGRLRLVSYHPPDGEGYWSWQQSTGTPVWVSVATRLQARLAPAPRPGTLRVRGRLETLTAAGAPGAGVPGARVRLEHRRGPARPWRVAARATALENGAVSFTTRARPRGAYRVVFAGNRAHDPATSPLLRR